MIGHIYRIIHLESDIQYVGSMFSEPRKRWQLHKSNYSNWLAGRCRKVSIYPFFEEHGIDKFKLIPIKAYDLADRTHLKAYEQLWINKLRCVNKVSPFQILKLYKRQYHLDNRESKLNGFKEYYKANKAQIAAKKAERIHCGCGSEIARGKRARHEKSKKHEAWAQSN
ncbi:unnamed protein product [Phytophthora lilii]|uniref:Unnamed protein product n=1 Tax=Phytophthora lilii TaxID=2077276 RepID=A0A9W7CQ18_9STRA|nr:unnamed protein product [Phytophthora lilii]